jgi:hypothetical protein
VKVEESVYATKKLPMTCLTFFVVGLVLDVGFAFEDGFPAVFEDGLVVVFGLDFVAGFFVLFAGLSPVTAYDICVTARSAREF